LADRTLVTGALGCLGAWTVRALLEQGDEPVGYDLGTDTHRLRLVLGEQRLRDVALVHGDVTDEEALGRALDDHRVTGVVHLAALQVPFCRADPALGARVNVLGTVSAFQAVRARRDRIPGIAYASSAAVYSRSDPTPAPESGGTAPTTLYGVYKLANEGTARIFWADDRVPSIGIRPYVVYGPGRDQGMTSGPSLAMRAAASGEGFAIGFGGRARYDFAPDVGKAFARAKDAVTGGAHVANFPGAASTMEDVVGAIELVAPNAAGRITWASEPLPFPDSYEAEVLERVLGPVVQTTLTDGVRETVEHFRRED
jgi:UDP-glucuronate 4-epimerase